MNHLSLFSGSGIGTLAAAACGIRTVAHAENDPACCYCLERLWPDARLFRDVRDVTAESVADLGPIDIISGGFPCQDVSTAGKGAGLGDEENPTRSGLWFEFARIIRQVRPRFILAENVGALRVRGGDRVCEDLESMGYTWEAMLVGADDVGAPHRRKRVWIVARLADGSRERRQQDSRRSLADEGEHARRSTIADNQLERARQSRVRVMANPILQPLGSGRPERGPEGRTTAGRAGEGGGDVANAERTESRDRIGQVASTEERRDRPAIEGCGGELAFTASKRRQELGTMHAGTPAESEACSAHARWPSRPGQPQHAWEAPRLIEFGVGGTATRLARRLHASLDGSGNGISPDRAASRANKTLLKMCGNSWVYPLAVILFQWIAGQHAN